MLPSGRRCQAASRAARDRVDEAARRRAARRRRSVAKTSAGSSSTAQPAATTQRTPISISASATPAAKRGAVVAGAVSAGCSASRAARWQQLRNTSSGTVRIAWISRGPRKVPSDSTTPPGASASGARRARARRGRRCARCGSGRSSSALMTRRASVALASSAPAISARTRRCRRPPAVVSAPPPPAPRARAPGSARVERRVAPAARRSPARRPSTPASSPGLAEVASCAACAAAWCGSPTAARRRRRRRRRAGVSSSSHGIAAVPSSSSMQHLGWCRRGTGSISTGTSSWNSVRPICGSWLRVVRWRGAPARAPARPAWPARAPRCARAGCRACRRCARLAVGALHAGGADEVVVGAAVAGVERPPQRAGADCARGSTIAKSAGPRVRQHLQAAPGLGWRGRGRARPAAGAPTSGQPLARKRSLASRAALRDQLRRLPGADAACRRCRSASPPARSVGRRAGRCFGHALGPGR